MAGVDRGFCGRYHTADGGYPGVLARGASGIVCDLHASRGFAQAQRAPTVCTRNRSRARDAAAASGGWTADPTSGAAGPGGSLTSAGFRACGETGFGYSLRKFTSPTVIADSSIDDSRAFCFDAAAVFFCRKCGASTRCLGESTKCETSWHCRRGEGFDVCGLACG